MWGNIQNAEMNYKRVDYWQVEELRTGWVFMDMPSLCSFHCSSCLFLNLEQQGQYFNVQ